MDPKTNHTATASEEPNRRKRNILFKLVAIAIGILVGLAATEVGLRLVERVRLGDRAGGATIPDSKLGTRMVPNTGGQDANGFRNASVRSHVDIVALGDSQTWGVNVQSIDAWPQQLERLSGLSVYNMGVGGYGPVHYWILDSQALSFSPRAVVVGLYLGNDIYDAYALAYANDNYVELRTNPEIKVDTIKDKVGRYWDEEKNFHQTYGRNSPMGWSFWLREHSAIGRLLNRNGLWPGATDVDYEIDKAWVHAYPDDGAVCEDQNIRTVFPTAYRAAGLDLSDPRIVEGLRLTKEVLLRTNQQTNQAGARLLVLMIPTKETVYAGVMQQDGKVSGNYARLVDLESSVRQDLTAWCAQQRIECVDALPNLRAAIESRKQLYPSTTESHPNATGYAVIAATVAEALRNNPGSRR